MVRARLVLRSLVASVIVCSLFVSQQGAEAASKSAGANSSDLRSAYSCALKGSFSPSTKAYEISKPMLTFPQRTFAAWKLVGQLDGVKERPAFTDIHAFADLGGDGTVENITKVSTFNTKPNRLLPVFIWNENKADVEGSNEYGLGSLYGIELKYLNLSKILVGDLNGDGVDDLVFLEYGEHDFDGHAHLMGGRIDVAISTGRGGRYKVSQIDADDNLWHQGVLVDVTGDGKLDIVAVGGRKPKANKRDGKGPFINVLLNDGDGTFRRQKFSGGPMLGALAAAAADMDGDQRPELIIATSKMQYSKPSTLHIFWSSGAKPTSVVVASWKDDPIIDITTGDYNSDGAMDIALLVAADDYKRNVVEVIELKYGVGVGERTVFDQPASNTFGRFNSLSEIITCVDKIFAFINSSPSVNSFFEIGR